MSSGVLTLLLLALACQPPPVAADEAHTYLSLWGPLFAGRSRDSTLNSTAPSAWLEEFHARLVALLNASHVPPLFGGGGDRAPFEGRLLPDWGPGAEGAGGLLNQLRELTPTLQRGALPSLIRHGPLGAARGLPSSPLEVPDAARDRFEPAVSLRLQNFGGADGFRDVFLGRAGRWDSDAASTEVAWGDSAAFLLQCTLSEGGAGASAGAEGGEDPEAALRRSLLALSSPFHQRLGALGEREGPAALTKLSSLLRTSAPASASCQLALSSSTGRAAMLKAEGLPLAAGPLNALSVRVCNKPPQKLVSSRSDSPAPSSVTLRDLHIGGAAVLRAGPIVATATQQAAPDGCTSRLYRLPTRTLAAGSDVVISGWLDLDEGGVGGFGVAGMASVVLELGRYSPLGGG